MDPEIVVLHRLIERELLARLVHAWFGDMVKYVVDLERQRAAVGGQLHADAAQVLLADGSRQVDLWGANYYPGLGSNAIEFTALVNIRPAQGNRSMEIEDESIRERVRLLTERLLGQGEALP